LPEREFRPPVKKVVRAGEQGAFQPTPRLTREDYVKAGLEKFIVEKSDHPAYYASLWPSGGRSLDFLGLNSRYRLPHVNTNSVLITVISNHYQENVWWRLQNMLRYSEDAGLTVALEEVDDMSTMPTDAIGIMRACAAKLALDAGFEWCFMVDTDALVEEDTLVRLVRHDVPIVYPHVTALSDDRLGGPLSSPRVPPDVGMQPVTWATMSAMLFNTKVFNCLDPYAWHGHDYHFAQCLNHFGHRIFVDTDTKIHVTRGPARWPTREWDDLFARLKRAYNSRQNDARRRGPPPDFDPAFSEGYVDKDGVYWGKESWAMVGVHGPMHREADHGANGNGRSSA
jgi:hypothetical protein